MKVTSLLSTARWVFWVPDSVRFAPLAVAAHLPFPGRGVDLSRVLYVHESSSSHDAKVHEVGFLAVKNPEWRLHLGCLMRSPVLEERHRHEQLPPHERWKTAVCQQAPSHGAQNSPHVFGYTDLLRRVDGCKLVDNTGLQGVLPKLLPGVLAALVGTPTNDAAMKGNGRGTDEQLKRLKSLVFAGQHVDGGRLSVFVGYLADVRVVTHNHWRKGLHQIPVAQLERSADLVVGCRGVNKLLSFPHGANVTARGSPLECNNSAV